MIKQVHKRITTNTTTPFFTTDVFVTEIVVFCSDAGTTWDLRIEDNAGSPAVILKVASIGLSGAAPISIPFTDGTDRRPGLRMKDGVDVVTSNSAGSDPGVVDVWITASGT